MASDKDAVRALMDGQAAGAVSTWIFSGPRDLVGDGRKELEAERPGTILETKILWKTDEPVAVEHAHYYGCVLTRVDSGIQRLEQLNGRAFAFSDETSTSGHIFPKMLLAQHRVSLGRAYMAGGHPNVVQAVWDGKAQAGSSFWSPPGKKQTEAGTLVGDARWLVSQRFETREQKRDFLDEVRVIARTDPIPNDVCATRKGFSEDLWQRFEASLQRFLVTPAGREAYFDLVAGVAAKPAGDEAFDGFREALSESGTPVDAILNAAEAKLDQKRSKE